MKDEEITIKLPEGTVTITKAYKEAFENMIIKTERKKHAEEKRKQVEWLKDKLMKESQKGYTSTITANYWIDKAFENITKKGDV